ncbi:hypothetical protein HX109_10985 [Galbibacter sp. BG1]|uniref:hypothetical protein n=1 Tax=Galbibacter sp. BG1 TaxID=1170699 RepID=UPI0015BBB07F|nr:hypothetical protein [Galbibacter sp. BG1]QLE02053.1 hypothetical protein HX109_10985 [Galbibacter sp. BG1]
MNELIVVMVITVIVIGLAYTVLNLVQSHMKGISYNLDNASENSLMQQALTIDINRFNEAYIGPNGKMVFRNELDSVTYFYEESYFVREVDTFNIEVGETSFYLDNREIYSGKFDAIQIEVNPMDRMSTIFIYRQNDAKTYMN